jgi:hypothetical protein
VTLIHWHHTIPDRGSSVISFSLRKTRKLYFYPMFHCSQTHLQVQTGTSVTYDPSSRSWLFRRLNYYISADFWICSNHHGIPFTAAYALSGLIFCSEQCLVTLKIKHTSSIVIVQWTWYSSCLPSYYPRYQLISCG